MHPSRLREIESYRLFQDASHRHDNTMRNGKQKKPVHGQPRFATGAAVKESLAAMHELWLEWLRIHMINYILDLDPVTTEEFQNGWMHGEDGAWVQKAIKDAPSGPTQRSQGLLDLL